ncbi:MAG TPA: acyl-CoA dehydrogenase family protein [Nocardioides sp.]|nr:acyl-CoA dehydrogenase family protein [Nocardioides sp.]
MPPDPTPDTDAEADQALREAVRRIVAPFGPGWFQEQVDTGGNGAELWHALGEAGYLGVHLPERYGGGGAGLRELAIVVEETAMAGVPVMTILFSPGVTGTILERSASEEQKRRWLPAIASGSERWSFAITEPEAGSNAHRIATTARRDGDAWVLRGQKHYITGIENASRVVVVARTGTDERTGRGRLSVLVVDADSPGLSFEPIRTVMNQPERSSVVRFDDVRVPAANLVGEEGRGLAVAFAGMNTERILASSICTGLGRYALARAASYARDRKVWDAPIGVHQGVAHPLAAAHIRLAAAVEMTDKACRLYDAGSDLGDLANYAKFLGAEAGLEALDAAIAVHGGHGVAVDTHLAGFFWIVRMLNMGPVSKEMILNFVAERGLGLPRSY